MHVIGIVTDADYHGHHRSPVIDASELAVMITQTDVVRAPYRAGTKGFVQGAGVRWRSPPACECTLPVKAQAGGERAGWR